MSLLEKWRLDKLMTLGLKKLSSYLPFSNIIVLNGCSDNGNFAFGLDFRYSQKSLLHLMLPN